MNSIQVRGTNVFCDGTFVQLKVADVNNSSRQCSSKGYKTQDMIIEAFE